MLFPKDSHSSFYGKKKHITIPDSHIIKFHRYSTDIPHMIASIRVKLHHPVVMTTSPTSAEPGATLGTGAEKSSPPSSWLGHWVSQDARNMGNIWGFHKWWYPKMGCQKSWEIEKKMDDKMDLGAAFLGKPDMEQMMTEHKTQHLQFFHKLGQTWTMTGARQKLNSIFTPTSLELRSSRI